MPTTFRQIHEVDVDSKGVVMLEIPPAPRGIPIAWEGQTYARAGESLSALGFAKQDEIRNHTLHSDWSAQIVEGATLDDLDPTAVERARSDFALKHQNRFAEGEVRGWPVATLLTAPASPKAGKSRARRCCWGGRKVRICCHRTPRR